MFTIAGAILLTLAVSFVVMVGISMIVKIWAHLDPVAKAEYDRLKQLVRRANKGDADAIKSCEIDSYNIKSGWWRKNRFSVRRKVLYACYGHQ